MDVEYCKICGQGSKTDHSVCHRIAMERLQKQGCCEHDNIRITEGGLRLCVECGAMLDQKQSKTI